jgi:hypothetical protein
MSSKFGQMIDQIVWCQTHSEMKIFKVNSQMIKEKWISFLLDCEANSPEECLRMIKMKVFR